MTVPEGSTPDRDRDAADGGRTRPSAPADRAAALTAAPSLPRGGGAIRGIGEKFAANPVTGTGSISVPVPTSPSRGGSGPSLALAYDSGAGNGPFGFGWSLDLPAVTRKTDRGIPRYRDAEDSDVFVLSGGDDLVPMLDGAGKRVVDDAGVPGFSVARYRPRTEGSFARIERWTRTADGDVHWRTLSPDNVLSVYGADAGSRIADPADPRRVFSWLLCETRDDRGNAMVVDYKAEDAAGVDVAAPEEVGRGDAASPRRKVNRYLKRVRYGNQVPLLDGAGRRPVQLSAAARAGAKWMFEVVLDYGEHDAAAPTPGDAGAWLCRNDPFSTHRAGFEVRTYRLCQRVLVFHHFPLEAGVGDDCLVRSLDLAYRESRGVADDRRRGHPAGAFLAAVTQRGHVRKAAGGYESKALPPLAFEYTGAVIAPHARTLDPESLENLPAGLADPTTQWVDLDGEGLPGILTEQADAWWYKRNLGGGRFGVLEQVATRPSLASLSRGQQALLDLAGDGSVDLVELEGEPAGFFERSLEEGWKRFVPFSSRPNVDWGGGNLQLVDLTGDGRADLLITDQGVFTWHESLGEAGFGPARRVAQPLDEERGPHLVLADGTQTAFLADMTGDGLTDLVRVRNGEVCYWPNLGYGRFGPKVTMRGAPRLDRPERFDPRRVRLGDVDGSGTVDLLYVGDGEVRLWFNQSGNGWSEAHVLPDFPHVDDLASVQLADLLGNGTACLVWSSPLPAHAGRALRYVDLMGGTKPHLLCRVVNNCGAETRVRYAASTRFYLSDREAGRPWVTRLPFPVHVVEHAEHLDHVSRTRFATRYAYHHGHFDGEEREFRGFAMVEQHDVEAFVDYVAGVVGVDGTQSLEPELWQPPVTTRTWFHTGAYLDGTRILHQLRGEYYRGEQHVPEPVLPAGMSDAEYREAVRALHGLTLRQEIYSFDGSARAEHPYSVSETGWEVRRLQPRAGDTPGVFFVFSPESVTLGYERDPADPRVAHGLALEVGPYGDMVRAASVTYGRDTVDPTLPAEVTEAQRRLTVTYSETDYTGDVDRTAPVPAYRLRAACETRSYEITGVAPAAARFTRGELDEAIGDAAEIDYEEVADGVAKQKRPLAQSRTLFRDDALAPLALGQLDSLGLPYRSFDLAFTPGVVAAHYGAEVSPADFAAAGYEHFDGDASWWSPSGLDVYPANPAARFYLPTGGRDPLGLETEVVLDRYLLLPELTRVKGAAWTEASVVNDYRVLGPVMAIDANQNRTAVEVDALGMVVKTAVMGKAGAGEGDTLADPTTRVEYDLTQWMMHGRPNFAHGFARERHGAANPRWQESWTYSNGSGGVAGVKVQAHPGKALRTRADGTVEEVDADPRWIGNGRTVLNNKGNVVKAYEPYFSTTHEYEDEAALRTIGAGPVHHYDAIGRLVRTEFPNGTCSRVEFDSWRQRAFDANDTVLESRWYTERGSPDPAGAEPGDPEQRAAWLAARHAGTPAAMHSDALGRVLYAVTDHGGGTTAAVRSETDLTGRYTALFDALGRQVASGFAAQNGTAIDTTTAERGRLWSFENTMGGVVRSWDEHGRAFRVEYDALHRPTATFVRQGAGPERLFNYVVYGDRHPDAVARNLRGTAHQVFDSAGMLQVLQADFKGNATSAQRVLTLDHTAEPDWGALPGASGYAALQAAAAPLLDVAEPLEVATEYDALNRHVGTTLHGGTVVQPTYNEANVLASLELQVEGAGPFVEFLAEQDYNARGQRRWARHGNGVRLRYEHDALTQRLTRLLAWRGGDDPATQALQDLRYTYDPVGNITQYADAAQQTHFFANAVVPAGARFRYDAAYQLVEARGRELAGLANDAIRDHGDLGAVPQLPHLNDLEAVRAYTEWYEYDRLGNLLSLRHATSTAKGNWTRRYRYLYQDDPADLTNRLAATSRPADPDAGPYTQTYGYDAYGNMTRLLTPTPGELAWTALDQLRRVDLGGGGAAYYAYGASGQRVRKVIERPGGTRTERIYLGQLEIYRERDAGGSPRFERRTLHVADDTGPIAQVDVKIRDDDGIDPANPIGVPLVRYQYGDHLGSAVLETDGAGAVISYEEYHPFGTTAYRSSRPGAELSLKRYRFAGRERDAETGLYYHGSRYYAPWLGRWTSADPAGLVDGLNLYRFCHNRPITLRDPSGTSPRKKKAPGDLNPAGEISFIVPPSVKTIKQFETWLPPDNPSRPYTPGTVTSRMVERTLSSGKKVKVPVFNAEWLDPATGKPLLPRVGAPGYVATWGSQPKPEYDDPADPKTIKTIKEHQAPRAQGEQIGDPVRAQSKSTPTMVNPKAVADAKTPGDNVATAQIKQRIAAGEPVDFVDDVVMESNRRQRAANASQGSPVPSGSMDRQSLSELGYKFEDERIGEAAGKLPAPSRLQRVGGAVRDVGRRLMYNFDGTNRLKGAGTTLARGFIPLFVEAEVAATLAHPFVVGTLGVSGGPLPAVAQAISAAPTTFAFAVTLPAIGGAVVGNVAESVAGSLGASKEVSIGAAVVAAAGTGAIIGTFIPIPGVGTAAGALIGAGIGLLGYGISKLF